MADVVTIWQWYRPASRVVGRERAPKDRLNRAHGFAPPQKVSRALLQGCGLEVVADRVQRGREFRHAVDKTLPCWNETVRPAQDRCRRSLC